MRSHHGLRRTSIVAGIEIALLVGAQPAAAAPTDTVFPVLVVGASVSAAGLPSEGAMYVTASTDPAAPGVTQFIADRYCCVFIHWRNISTGAAGIAYLGYPSVEAQTGAGHRGRRRHSADRAAELPGSDGSARWWRLDSPLTEPVERVHRQLPGQPSWRCQTWCFTRMLPLVRRLEGAFEGA
ncbi:hypothetical protein ACHMZP_34020 [Rhodococcus baikonurensis]|uniref:hypothetical protein n=1 Tax=Rhodococcus baikonurensis TaxID=172041 RepID=UPI0037A2EF4D